MHELIRNIKNQIIHRLPGDSAHREMFSNIRVEQMKTIHHNEPPRESAVLILLYEKGHSWHIPLIKRTIDNHAHSGQIALPGGRYEAIDGNLMNTALRETEEEIGIAKDDIEILGPLTPLYIPPSNFNVAPFIGRYKKGVPAFTPDHKEVDHIINITYDSLRNPDSISTDSFRVRDIELSTPCFKINGYTIWGATAMILNEFISLTR